LVNKVADAHCTGALGADKGICFVDLPNEVRPMSLRISFNCADFISLDKTFPNKLSLFSEAVRTEPTAHLR